MRNAVVARVPLPQITMVSMLSLGLLPALSCSETRPATQILAVVYSNLAAGEQLSRIKVRIVDSDADFETSIPEAAVRSERDWIVAAEPDRDTPARTLPFSFAIVPPSENELRDFRIVVTGYGRTDESGAEIAIVEQMAKLGYRKNEKLLLEIFLWDSCLNTLCEEERMMGEDSACTVATGRCAEVPTLRNLRRAGDNPISRSPRMTIPDSGGSPHVEVDAGTTDAGGTDATGGQGGSAGSEGGQAGAETQDAGSTSEGSAGAAGAAPLCNDAPPDGPIVCGSEMCPLPNEQLAETCVRPCCVMTESETTCGLRSSAPIYVLECAAATAEPDPRCPSYTSMIAPTLSGSGCCTASNECGVLLEALHRCVTEFPFFALPQPPIACDAAQAAPP